MSGSRRSLLTTEGGFTLLELIGAMALLLMLTGAVTFAYIAILKGMDEQISRSQARGSVNIALEGVVVDLRHCFAVTVDGASKAIRYQVKESGSSKFSIYYLQSQTDGACPSSSFDSTALYDLMNTPLQGGNIDGTFTCGDGSPVIRNIVPPPTSNITLSGKTVTLDLTTKVKSSSIRVMTSVTARNL